MTRPSTSRLRLSKADRTKKSTAAFGSGIREVVEASARTVAKAVSLRAKAAVAGDDRNVFERQLAEKLAASLTRSAAILLAGKEVQVIEDDPLLTTQEAADLLQVSRPHIVKLLDSGAIQAAPSAGNQRRVRRSAITTYQRTHDKARAKALRDLATLAQKHDMGY